MKHISAAAIAYYLDNIPRASRPHGSCQHYFLAFLVIIFCMVHLVIRTC
uniref:Uncharacterized protein n=1 Tax=Arundo donax TaxID=35708 RepID=A0A0A9E8A7_ARUDO